MFPVSVQGLHNDSLLLIVLNACESESSSSSDEGERPAKRRRKVDKRPVVVPAMAAVRRRDVWSSVLLEDRIEQELKEVGVRRGPIDRSRDVESYDYPRPGYRHRLKIILFSRPIYPVISSTPYKVLEISLDGD